MVKEGYKEVTALGEEHVIPEDWNLTELNEVLSVIRNGSSKKQNKQGEGLPVSRIETIADGTINYDKIGYVDVKPNDLKKHELEKGDVLFSHINSIAHIGKVAQYQADKKLYHGMNLLKLRFDNKKVTDQFMLHRLKSTNAKHFYERYAKQAVNQASLNQNDVGLYTFPLPSLPEQEKIASILSSVDKSIEKTDEVIEETKELKKGLMQELLIKGIGHSEFKEVRIGAKTFKLPKSWDLKTVGSLFKLINGRAFKTDEWADNGLQIIRIQDLRENDNAETNYCNFEVKDKYYVYNNDLLFCWAGNIKTSLGAYIWNKDKAVLNQHIYNMKPKINLSKSYYKFLINKFLPLLKNYTGGSAGQVHITKGDFKTFDVPVPPLEEQKKISSILSSVDTKIKKEEEYKAKLERLKKGLMQKLLTGEIRVNTEMEV